MGRLHRWLRGRLQTKLLRDLAASKGLFLAVTLVIFLGVAFFGASFLAYRNLKSSYDYSYEALRFADFTVKTARQVDTPAQVLAEIDPIPGVEAVTGRLNAEFALTLPGGDGKKVMARVISLPSGSRAAVNDVKLEEGAYLEKGSTHDLLVEKSFAEHHGLSPGDGVFLNVGGQDIGLSVAGIVTSPEYIWPAKSRQEILVSPETFGVVFVSSEAVPDLVGVSAVNEFCILVEDGADSGAAISAVEAALTEYQVVDVVAKEDQPSNAALKLDLQGFGEMAEVFPLLFLIVGALATYILLNRIVQNQRSQIGLMRALGYSRRQVLVHYLSFALIIGAVGAVAGVIAGYLLSAAVTRLYVGMLGLPFMVTRMGWVEWLAMEEALMLGIVPCMVAGIIPALAASRTAPAEAMRTPPPTAGRRLLVERLLPFLGRVGFLWRIPLRNIFRSRRRSLYTVIGVAFGISLILVSAAFIDSIESLIDLQFNRIQRYDAQVSFAEPQPATVVDDMQVWSASQRVEPVLQLPVRLDYGGKSYSTLAVGLSPQAELYGLYSSAGNPVTVTDQGILLSEGLRSTLGINVGDVAAVRSAFAVRQLTVAGFVKQPMGSYGYVTLAEAQGLSGGEAVVSGVMVDVGPGQADIIREQAYQLPAAGSVELTAETLDEVNDLMGLLRVMMWVMMGFGAALALAIVFTTVTISIVERRREIATMRTLGEGRARITAMLTLENLLLGFIGIIPGIALGYALAVLFFSLVQTDMMSFDLVVFPRTYLLTVGVIILIMLVSQWPGIRHVQGLDLARVIKEQVT